MEENLKTMEEMPENAEEQSEGEKGQPEAVDEKVKDTEEKTESTIEGTQGAEEKADNTSESLKDAEEKAENANERMEGTEAKAESVDKRSESTDEKQENVEEGSEREKNAVAVGETENKSVDGKSKESWKKIAGYMELAAAFLLAVLSAWLFLNTRGTRLLYVSVAMGRFSRYYWIFLLAAIVIGVIGLVTLKNSRR